MLGGGITPRASGGQVRNETGKSRQQQQREDKRGQTTCDWENHTDLSHSTYSTDHTLSDKTNQE